MAHGKSDYGAPARDRAGRTRTIMTLVGAAVSIAVVAAGVIYMESRRQAAAAAQSAAQTAAFAVDGPPCPSLSAAEFAAQPLQTRSAFIFNEVTFARRFGHSDCAMTEYAGGGGVAVCQFTGPAALVVTTPKGAFHFLPGMGRRATVSVHDDQPRCVLGGKFGTSPS